jgi:hypothetical protein
MTDRDGLQRTSNMPDFDTLVWFRDKVHRPSLRRADLQPLPIRVNGRCNMSPITAVYPGQCCSRPSVVAVTFLVESWKYFSSCRYETRGVIHRREGENAQRQEIGDLIIEVVRTKGWLMEHQGSIPDM